MKWRELANDPLFNLECYLDLQDKKIEEKDKEIELLKAFNDLYIDLLNQSEDNIKQLIKKLNEYKSRCKKANDFIDNYDVFKEFSFPLMKRYIENQIKSSIDYEFNSTFRKNLKNILNGSDDNE